MGNLPPVFMGIDASTQGLKATLLDEGLNVVSETALNFDRDFPEYKTEGGVHRHTDGLTVTSPPLMWVAALDRLFERLKSGGAPLDRVVAISGSGQQHGSVWLKPGTGDVLAALDPALPLLDQLAEVFSVDESPIWMDASTTKQCRKLEERLGGAQAVADITGSRAYERFTGNQIARIYEERRELYDATERIALVSSFIASLLTGGYAPIDTSDGSGMNLMDIRKKDWSQAALDATAAGLAAKLGQPVAGHTAVGMVSDYLVRRYGLNAAALVIAFSGDNPCSLAGLRLQKPGDIAVSLGTSDTLFGSAREPQPSGVEGHVFANPVDPGSYMVMLVHQNGSLTREKVRDLVVDDRSWQTYRDVMSRTAPGNNGKIGLYLYEPEITPPILRTGVFRFDAQGAPVEAFAPGEEARAVLESQFMSLRVHAESIGLRPANIIATGGASVDPAVIRVLCDVFGVPVRVAEKADSASFGAAYRALHGWKCAQAGAFVEYEQALAGAAPYKIAAEPDMQAHQIYTEMLPRIGELERKIAEG